MATPDPPVPAQANFAASDRNPLRGRVASAGNGPASAANIANIITVLRIFLAPVFIWLLLADNGALAPARYLAAALFVFAIVTDTLDGLLARRLNLETNIGRILDPIADKVLIGSALIALSVLGELWWWVTSIILIREFGITIFRFVVIRRRVIPATASGKFKTVLQAVAISLLLFPLWSILGQWYLLVGWFAMSGALALTVISGVDFGLKYRKQNRLAL